MSSYSLICREEVLNQYLSNKEYRSSVLKQSPSIMNLTTKMQSFGKVIIHYEDVVNMVLSALSSLYIVFEFSRSKR